MIKKTIALLAVISIASALSGCSSEEENSNTRVGGNFITGNIYECGAFKFTINGKYDDDYASDDKTSYKFYYGDEYEDPMIRVDSRTILFDDLKTYIDITVGNTSFYSVVEDDIVPTSTDVVTDLDCDYAAGAIHYEFDDGKGISYYYIENETRALEIKASYLLPKKKSVCKDVEKLISSVEYISDFKLPTEDTKIDNDYISAAVPKEWLFDERAEGNNKILYGITINKSRAKTEAESGTFIILRVKEKDEESPEETVDKLVERRKDSEYGETTHIKYKIFGIETECAETIQKSSTDRWCYFEHGGLSWTALLSYTNDDELADIEYLLNRIELK